MPKLTRETLNELRNKKRKEMKNRDISDKNIIISVAMGTCGISAGAKKVFYAFTEELEAKDLNNVIVKQVACMNKCDEEPMVGIKIDDQEEVIYAKVNPEIAKEIVSEHIIGKKIIKKYVLK